MKARLVSIAAVLLLVAFAGCVGGPQQTSAPTTPSAPTISDADKGKALYASKACSACHGANGEGVPDVGPALKGLYGTQLELDAGQKVTAEEAYLTESIKDPDAKIAKGFQKGMMVATVPKGSLSDEEVKNLVAYIKTLK